MSERKHTVDFQYSDIAKEQSTCEQPEKSYGVTVQAFEYVSAIQ